MEKKIVRELQKAVDKYNAYSVLPITQRREISLEPDNCGLCGMYIEGVGTQCCVDCPVAEHTGKALCVDTPYAELSGAHGEFKDTIGHVEGGEEEEILEMYDKVRDLCAEEARFLLSLIPEDQR